jgi:hypothetical protein
MKTFLLLLVVLAGPNAFAQTVAVPSIPATGRRLADFIPAGYDTLRRGRATGDLNHDGRPDMALVLGAAVESTTAFADDDLPARILLVLFGTPTGYALVAQSQQAVWCKTCSMNGDPFDGIVIEHGVLLVKHDVGGNWGHSLTAKFRYQQENFYLIGETNEYSRHAPDCDQLPYPPRYDYRDTNFVTGDYEIIRTSEQCRLLVKKRGKNNPKPLRKLADYAVML